MKPVGSVPPFGRFRSHHSYLRNHQIKLSLEVAELAERGDPGVKQLVQTIETVHHLRDL